MPNPRKPTALKVLDGSARKDPQRLNPAEPEPPRGLGEPPAHLSDRAKEVWKDEGPYWSTVADRGAFARYCQHEADAWEHRATCEADGYWQRSQRGTFVLHPAARLMMKCFEQAQRISVEFGMTPASRSRVSVPQRPQAEDPGAEFD